MKKFYLLIMAAVFAMPVFAQNDYMYYLSNVRASDDFEEVIYQIDESFHVGIVEYKEEGQPSFDRYIFYDDNGNLIKIETHQYIDGEYVFVNYIEYSYNDLNQRITRTNYNNFGGSFELGGTYYYSYDDNGNMVYWELDFAGGIYQKCEITYNEDNNVIQEIGYDQDFSGVFQNSWKIDYEYDNQGNRLSRTDSYWMGSFWSPTSTNRWTYDEYGNCIVHEVINNGVVVEKSEYNYDLNINIGNVVLFENPEGNFPVLPFMNNAVVSEKYYLENDVQQLVHAWDYIYSYEEINTTYVDENELSLICYPNPASSSFMIQSEDVENVEIYNMLGNKVFSGAVNGSRYIDVTEFANGIYIVKMFNDGKTSTGKLVVRR